MAIGEPAAVKLFIRERRKKLKMSQEALGERIGVVKSTISRWENGDPERQPGSKELAALAEALNCQIPDLYRNPKEPSADALLQQAPESARPKILELMELMVKQAS